MLLFSSLFILLLYRIFKKKFYPHFPILGIIWYSESGFIPIVKSLLFLCRSSEVVADDTPAVQAVLKADTRRLKLLEDERQLQSRLDKGDDSVAERLDKVRQEQLAEIL